MKTKLIFQNNFPAPTKLAEHPVLIFDNNLLANNETAQWIQKFPNKIGVTAGEGLKQFNSFETHFIQVLKIVDQIKTKNITLIGLGGGSVGDFVGFMASVFKRGVPLIHIPSTWLAAIDSSHGGKTAINVAGYKNQMGTFYPAEKIYLIKSLLFTQPQVRVQDAMGEIIKTVLLSGGTLWKKTSTMNSFSQNHLWKILPDLIAYKYKIVKKDPFETKGIRFVLNFGHTFGHVLESAHKLPHGEAVNYGLRMALEFSKAQKLLTPAEFLKLTNSSFLKANLKTLEETSQLVKQTADWEKQLLQDKKASQNSQIRYVFLKKPGQPLVKSLSTQEILAFIKGHFSK